MLATSYPVQPHRPMRTNSMGLGAVFLSPSTTIEWELLASLTKRCWSIQIALASVIVLLRKMRIYLTAVIRRWLRMNQYPEKFWRILLKSNFQIGLDVMHA